MTKRSKLYLEETEGGESFVIWIKGNTEIIDIDDTNALHLFAPICVFVSQGTLHIFLLCDFGIG